MGIDSNTPSLEELPLHDLPIRTDSSIIRDDEGFGF